jgi:hypothetical protein
MKKYVFLSILGLILVVSILVIRPFSLHAEQFEGKSPFAAIADSLSSLSVKKLFQSNQPQKAFSAIGTISEIGEQKLTLSQADGSDQSNENQFVINTTEARFETKDYAPLVFADIKVGDRVIAKGFIRGSEIFARRIISMTATSSQKELPNATSTPEVATSTPQTATSTPDTATSTPDTATTTPDTTIPTDTSTTTPETQTPVDTNTSTTTPTETSTTTSSSPETVPPSQPEPQPPAPETSGGESPAP